MSKYEKQEIRNRLFQSTSTGSGVFLFKLCCKLHPEFSCNAHLHLEQYMDGWNVSSLLLLADSLDSKSGFLVH